MDLGYGMSGSGDEETSDSRKGKKQYHRHSAEQIQQLEAYYWTFTTPAIIEIFSSVAKLIFY